MQEGRIPNVIFMSFLGIFCAGTLKVQNAAADIGPVRIEIRAKARAWQRTKEGKMSVSQVSATSPNDPLSSLITAPQSSSTVSQSPPTSPSTSTKPQQDTVSITNQSGQAVISNGQNEIQQDFQNLSNDLAAGNIAAAQRDFAALQEDLQQADQKHHHHHHRHHDEGDRGNRDDSTLRGHKPGTANGSSAVISVTLVDITIIGSSSSSSLPTPDNSGNDTAGNGGLVNVTA